MINNLASGPHLGSEAPGVSAALEHDVTRLTEIKDVVVKADTPVHIVNETLHETSTVASDVNS